ncbi:MAG TPA: hypothetical protein VIW45_16365, partial [Vicinamibacterales bacterium]
LSIVDTNPIVVDGTNDEKDPVSAPYAAASGIDYLVTWSHTMSKDVFAKHLDLRPQIISSSASGASVIGKGIATSTIWTGSQYATAFTTPAGAVMGATLGTVDAPAPVRPFLVSSSGDGAQLVFAAGRLTAAYQRLAKEPAYGGVFRVFVRDAGPVRGHAASR